MIVEIIGLPSVGKSSILSSLDYPNPGDKICLIGKKPCSYRDRLIVFTKFFLRLLFFYPRIMLDIKSSFWLLSKISYRLCNYKNDIKEELCIVNDTGILMPIISFLVQRNEYSYKVDLNKIISAIPLPLPDIVVFVEAEVNTVVERYANRGGILRNGVRDPVVKDLELYKRFLLGHETLLSLQRILDKKGCKIITINNNDCDNLEKIPSILVYKLIHQLD
jgi:hypothetical protein